MKNQNNQSNENQYDVIVVGAGNGGLVAAATTAKSGLKTLLLEKNNLPGGCASSFVRGRFEFEPSLHELCSVGTEEEPDQVTEIFNNLGVKIEWQRDDILFRTIVKGENGYDVRVKAGVEAFCDSLEAAVPGCRESVHSLFDVEKINEAAVAYNEKMKGKPNLLKMLIKYTDFIRSSSHSVEEMMTALGIPEKAQNIINTYWSYLGVPTDELNAFHFLLMVNSYVKDGVVIPHYRSHELAIALAEAVQRFGGDIWYNSEVTKFLFNEKGAVCGVVANGQELYAKEVISNIIPHSVYNLSEQRHIPQIALKLANARTFGLSMMTAYIGLDCTKEELGIEDYTIFVASDANPRRQFDNRKKDLLYIVNCLNVIIPDCSPEGTCMLFVTVPWLGSDFPALLKPQDYKKYRTEFIRKYIEDFEKLMNIDIQSHIEEIEYATPATFARYLGTPEGTAYGYAVTKWDSVMARNTAKEKTKIPGLSFCGGHGINGDGFSCAYVTGDMVAKEIIKKLEK